MAAGHAGGVAWYGGYHGQLNYLGEIRHVQEIEGEQELSEWLTDHQNGVLMIRLSRANIAALKNAGIDASHRAPLSSVQIEQISQILRTD